MTHKTTITDNYILITSDEDIKFDDWVYNHLGVLFQYGIEHTLHPSTKKVIAHLPLGMYSNLEGVVELPPLPSGKEKYRFTEEDMRNAIEMYMEMIPTGDTNPYMTKRKYTIDEIIQSLSQPKMPTHFKVETESGLWGQGHYVTYPKIINGVMQGEWIY